MPHQSATVRARGFEGSVERLFCRPRPAFWLVLVAAGLGFGPSACSCEDEQEKKLKDAGAEDASVGAELDPELAKKVLARVGDRMITLGDYVATLRGMDQFERLRYQSADRRRQLLEDLIDVELLAEEAKRRGLDKLPETRRHIRQILRDELLERARDGVPRPEDLPENELRAYYERHKSDFRDPERRRVAHLVVKQKALAEKLLEQAKSASPAAWGKLVREHSQDAAERSDALAPELAGDLGIVSSPGADASENPDVPEELVRAVFEIKELGDVYPKVVESGGRYHIVRLTGRTEARERRFAEAERTIRVLLVQERIRQAEAKLEAELRKEFDVVVDDEALEKVKVPVPAQGRTDRPSAPGKRGD